MKNIRTNVSMPKPMYDKILANKAKNETISECVGRMLMDYICDHDYEYFKANLTSLNTEEGEGYASVKDWQESEGEK